MSIIKSEITLLKEQSDSAFSIIVATMKKIKKNQTKVNFAIKKRADKIAELSKENGELEAINQMNDERYSKFAALVDEVEVTEDNLVTDPDSGSGDQQESL